jgi:hypothetical protein
MNRVHNFPNYFSFRSILIWSSHIRLGIPKVFFTSGFLPKILYAFRISPMRATSSDYLFSILRLAKYSEVPGFNTNCR